MDEQQRQLNIPYPPDFVFKYRANREDPVANIYENREMALYLYDHLELPGQGMNMWYKEVPYPRKGFPFPEAVNASDYAKKTTISLIRMFSRWPSLEWILRNYVEICERTLRPFILKKEYYIPFDREVLGLIERFFLNLKIDPDIAERAAECFATQLEYDDAYRLPLQDAMSNTFSYFSESPITAFKYIAKTIKERDKGLGIWTKFHSVAKLFNIILLIPKYRMAFIHSAEQINWDNVIPDTTDRYNELLWNNYDFGGLPFEERSALYDEQHKDGYPQE